MTARPAAALLLAALPVLAVQAQASLPGLPDARLSGLDQVRVAIPQGAVAGHSMAVYEVRSVLPPRLALAEVERHWRSRGADVVLQARSGDWFVLSQRLDGLDALPSGFETLQLRARTGGGSKGLLTRWFHPGMAVAGEDAPGSQTDSYADPLTDLLPADARDIRRFTSDDRDRQRGTTLVGHLDDTLERAEARVDRHLRQRGFQPMTAADDPRALRWRDDSARFYRDDARELLVTLHGQADGVGLVLHLMEKAP